MLKFFDSGVIPYKGYYREALYELFPKQIKYLRKGVKCGGRVLECPLGGWPIIRSSDKYVIGNIYEISNMDIINYIKDTMFGGGYQLTSIKIGDDTCWTLSSCGPALGNPTFPSLREYAKTLKDQKFIYE